MTPTGEVDLRSDSGYRRLSGNLLRPGNTPSGKPVVHRIDAYFKPHRLQVRSSYSAETLATAHNLED
eukprot:4154697-Pyramimonas_sp.AAC.1